MKLRHLRVEMLYGSLELDVPLNSDLTLLVGINGCGKTSALNFIDALLAPDLGYLSTTPFKSAMLEFEHHGRVEAIEAKQDARKLSISRRDPPAKWHPVTVRFAQHPLKIDKETLLVDLIEHYGNLRPERREQDTWNYLHKLPRPITITLDRHLAAEADGVEYQEQPHRRRIARSPLSKVREVTARESALFKSVLIALNDRLKARLVVSAFHDPLEPARHPVREVSAQAIDTLQAKVNELVTTGVGHEADEQVAQFFRSAKQVMSARGKNPRIHEFLAQYFRIGELTDAFEEYEREVSTAYGKIRRYLEAVNKVLGDSGKHVAVNDAGVIGFHYIDAAGARRAKFNPIESLSSGESQILTLFTFLAFITSPDNVFIVDEPEISLHPKWQGEFLEHALRLAPEGTQIVVATHSPEIVANHTDACVALDVLLPRSVHGGASEEGRL